MAMDNLTANHFTAHSLGNANDITASIGAVECLICAVSVWFLYWQANKMRNLARRMTHLETTAANYTVQVGKMPTDCKEAECANFFSAFGPVVHVGISYTYRELIIASRARRRREELLRCQVAWYLAKSKDQPGRVKKRAAIGVAHAKHRLYKADVAPEGDQRSCRTPCTGTVFVTFDTVEAAQHCIAECKSEKWMRGSGPLTVAMAPEPADVIWENLQVSRTERYLRAPLVGACRWSS